MKLIDAEPLIGKFEQNRQEFIDIEPEASFAYEIARQALEEAPTVEAIPIEWIIKWNEDYAPRDYREMTEDMIADWREEQSNETD